MKNGKKPRVEIVNKIHFWIIYFKIVNILSNLLEYKILSRYPILLCLKPVVKLNLMEK